MGLEMNNFLLLHSETTIRKLNDISSLYNLLQTIQNSLNLLHF
jgi:hypothetical protein